MLNVAREIAEQKGRNGSGVLVSGRRLVGSLRLLKVRELVQSRFIDHHLSMAWFWGANVDRSRRSWLYKNFMEFLNSSKCWKTASIWELSDDGLYCRSIGTFMNFRRPSSRSLWPLTLDMPVLEMEMQLQVAFELHGTACFGKSF